MKSFPSPLNMIFKWHLSHFVNFLWRNIRKNNVYKLNTFIMKKRVQVRLIVRFYPFMVVIIVQMRSLFIELLNIQVSIRHVLLKTALKDLANSEIGFVSVNKFFSIENWYHWTIVNTANLLLLYWNSKRVITISFKKIIFSNEVHFYLSGVINKQNWCEENSQLIYKKKKKTIRPTLIDCFMWFFLG